MDFTRQFTALLVLNLESVRERLGSVFTIVIGVTCAVGVLISMLAMGTGATRQATGDARPDRVILSSHGARGLESSIPRDEAATVRDLPGIKRGRDGEPIVVFQAAVPVEAHRRVTGNRIFFPLLGVTGASISDYAPEIRFTDGRSFRPGLHELVASNPCVRQFTGFELGGKRDIGGSDWTIVGHFTQGHSEQCVLLADAAILMSALNRNVYNQVAVMLESPQSFTVFRQALEANPTLHLEARREPEAIEQEIKRFNQLLNFAAFFVGSIMAVGATLGAVNSLYSIVDARRRELATLRAIGFGSTPIAAAMLVESILLALPGALLGAALAWALFHGMSVSPFGFSFELDVTPALALTGIAWALVMGLIGGILPAIRAGRVPVTTALRAI
ncbi:MAG: ABC transporter permease [Steroidobacteraceae bacterium]